VEDLFDVTVILLKCLYRDQVFITIGYYLSYQALDELKEGEIPAVDRVQRMIRAEDPRITRHEHPW